MLNARQQQMYTFGFTLFSPAEPSAIGGLSDPMSDRMRDIGYNPVPAATNVPGYFRSAAEVDTPSFAGLVAEANLFTFYVISFEAKIAQTPGIDNTWVIRLDTPADSPNAGTYYVCTDVPKVTIKAGLRDVNRAQVLCKRINQPNGIV